MRPRPSRLVPAALGLAPALALLACQVPEMMRTNIAGQVGDDGEPIAEPIRDPAVIAAGELVLDDTRIAGIVQAYYDLLRIPEGPYSEVLLGYVDVHCPAGMDTIPEACVGWVPNPDLPKCFATDTSCTPGEPCLTFVWRDGPPSVPAPLDGMPVEMPWFSFYIDGASDGCASVPIDIELPSLLVDAFPRLLVYAAGMPEIARYTTLGPAGETTCDALGCDPEEPQSFAGLWFPVVVRPEVPIERQFGCSIAGATATGSLCDQVLNNFDGDETPGEPEDVTLRTLLVSVGGCTNVTFGFRLDSLPLAIGFVPVAGAPGGGEWTATAFPGAKDFHLDDMFRVAPVVAGLPDIHVGGPDASADVSVWKNLEPDGPTPCSVAEELLNASGELDGPLRSRVSTALADIQPRIQAAFFDRFMRDQGNAKVCSVTSCVTDDGSEPTCNTQPAGAARPCCCATRIDAWLDTAMTYQKWSWFAGAFGPYPQPLGTGWLPVTAVTPHTPSDPLCDSLGTVYPACDGVPTTIVFSFANDQDGDGIVTPDDPAPTCWDDVDSDGDGTPDGCDGCPHDPATLGDGVAMGGDGDGVCGDIDNCPTIANPAQANCNYAAELAWTPGDHRGDACDPVPCPAVAPVYATSDKDAKMVCKSLTGLAVRPMQPQFWDDGLDYEDLCPPGYPLEAVKTHFRWCSDDPTTSIDCYDVTNLDPALLGQTNCAPDYPGPEDCAGDPKPLPELPTDPWHRMSFTDDDASLRAYGYCSDWDHPGSVPLPWEWQADVARWLGTGFIDPSTVNFWGGVSGVVWAYASSFVGTEGLPFEGKWHGDWLASSAVGVVTTDCEVAPIIATPLFDKCVIDPASCLALPWRPDIYINPADLYTRFDARGPDDVSLLVALADGGVGAVLGNGLAERVDERLSRASQAVLADTQLTWLSASEPSLAIGAYPRAPMALALTRDGALVDGLVSRGGRLTVAADEGLRLASGAAPSGFERLVYARSRGEVYALGRELAALRVGQARWRTLGAGTLTGGRVVAATWNHRDEVLVWVEQSGDLVALVEADPIDGTSSVVWSGRSAWEHHLLATGLDGSLLLAVSRGDEHAVMRVAVGGGRTRVTGRLDGAGRLLAPPWVDAWGVSSLTFDERRGAAAVVRDAGVPRLPDGASEELDLSGAAAASR